MFRGNIESNKKTRINATGRYVIDGSIGSGAVIDARTCELEVLGNRGDNVTIHCMKEPIIHGSKGTNVTYYFYDGAGNCIGKDKRGAEVSIAKKGVSQADIEKALLKAPSVIVGAKGPLVVGPGQSVKISVCSVKVDNSAAPSRARMDGTPARTSSNNVSVNEEINIVEDKCCSCVML